MTTKQKMHGIMIIAAVLLVVVALIGAASATPGSAKPNGDGSYGNPYQIEEAGHLTWMADNAGTATKGSYFKFVSDIDCGGETLKIIGNSSNKFSGIIDGNYTDISNFSISGSSNTGLFGYYNGTRIANLTISNFSVSGNNYVGGLVGCADSASECAFENVTAKFGNVTGSENVGGLIGTADSASSFHCLEVKNCSVSGSYNVGGQVGSANSASSFSSSEVWNCSVSGSGCVGGLIGNAISAISGTAFMHACSITNCIVSAGSENVGGLVGYADSAANNGIGDCVVEKCTIVSTGSENVGGLVGYASSASKFNTGNKLIASAVRGNGEAVANISGYPKLNEDPTNVTQTEPVWLNNDSNEQYPMIYIAKSTVSSKQGPEKPGYFNDTTADIVPYGAKLVTNLTGYGPNGQYAALAYVYPIALKYTVTNDTTIVNGTISGTPTEGTVGTIITVTANPDPGYHLNWTYWYNESEATVTHDIASSLQFTIPAKNVTVSGDFKPNQTTVKYYNNTNALVNTSVYTFGGPFVIPVYPENSSVIVNGWNVSTADGYYFANATFADINEMYVTSDVWNYTNATETVLTIYMNYTLIPYYEIDNTTYVQNGTVIANKTEAKAGEAIHVDAYNTTAGYHFNEWNVTNSTGTIPVDAEGNFTMPASDVNVAANFTANVTTVVFHTDAGTENKLNTYGLATNVSVNPTKAGCTFVGWNVSDGGSWHAFNSDAYNKSGIWNYTGADKGTLNVYANWTVNTSIVSIDTLDNGSVDADPKGSVVYGTDVALTNASDSGYHFVQYDIYKTGSTEEKVVNSSNQFSMPDYAVNVSGIFAGNTTTVEFFNGSVSAGTKLNTYYAVTNATPVLDPYPGYTFAGWNVTSASGTPFNSGAYNKSGIWNYTGIDGGTLNVYANWTVNTSIVSIDTLDNGSVDADPKGSVVYGTDVTLTNTSDSGYHFVQYDIYKTGSKADKVANSSNKFTMPDYAVNVSGIFAGNTTTVTFYNLSTPLESKINTYNTATNVTTTVPVRAGYTFSGWNVSTDAGWQDFNSTGYNESGTWKYIGADKGTLNVYANWTAIPTYQIDTTTVNGMVIASKTTAAAGEEIHVDAFNTTLGYHFNEWNVTNSTGTILVDAEGNFTMPASAVNAGANFTANATTVTFHNDTSTESKLNHYGLATNLSVNPTKEGYTFAGWNVSSASGDPFNSSSYNNNGIWNYTGADKGTLDVYANWTVNISVVSVDSMTNGSVNAMPNGSVAYGKVVTLTNASDSGYHLVQYDIYKTGTPSVKVENSSNQFSMPDYAVNVSGIFAGNTTTVEFFNGSVSAGTKLNTYYAVTNATPVLDPYLGYIFAGWNVSSEYGTPFNSTGFNNSGIWNYTGIDGGTLNVYANWTAIPTYQIGNATVNGTVVADKSSAMAGEIIHVDAFNTTLGYHFNEWNVTNSTGTIPVGTDGNFTMSASAVNAGANFTANATTVHFNNGTGTEDKQNTFGFATVKPADPVKEGYTFAGWNVSSASGTPFNSSSYNNNGIWNFTGADKGTLDVYANWTANVTTIVFHTNETTENKLNTFGQVINFSANPTKSGYTFTHWNVSSTGLDLNSSTYVKDGTTWNYIDADNGILDVSANWTPITYTVHFDANGGQGSMDDMTFTYDEGQNLTANAFQRYNSNFLYWTYNGTRYYNTEFVQNLTNVSGGGVTMTAQWETYSTGGSSSGTSYLGSNSASYTPIERPTATPTAKLTKQPATQTVAQTAKPTPQPTQQSPAPFVGILAGLGVAAVLLRLRK